LNDLVIFDGVCNLCARSAKFTLAHESEPRPCFVPLQSAALVADGKPHVKSDAAVRVSRYLRGGWRLLGAVRALPRPVRDWAYDLVARNRYRWYGCTESCMVPTPELRARFIDQ
jgi:predicted DCC family thiol-disulfide oxidoreductase YuxK